MRVRGLAVDDDGLVLRSSRLYPAAHTCSFQVNGLHVFRRSDLRGVLAWDDGRGPDSTPVQLGTDPQSGRWSIQPYLNGANAAVGTNRRSYPLRRRGRRRWQAETETAAALAAYLCATPAARPALADLDRLADVVDEALELGGGVHVAAPTAVAHAEVHARVHRYLDTEYRRFQGRPVDKEPWPTVDAVVAWLAKSPPPGMPAAAMSTDTEVRLIAAALVNVASWPFARLLGPPDDNA